MLEIFHRFPQDSRGQVGEPPSLDAICSATAQLATFRQAGITMCNYIMIFRECAAVVRWEECLLRCMFVEGISPGVRTLLGNLGNFQSLSMLQVAAAKAYSVY